MKFPRELFVGLVCFLPARLNGFRSCGWIGKLTRIETSSVLLSGTTNSVVVGADDDKPSIDSLPLPPSRKPGPFRGIRESISHLSNNQRFVRKRAEELGDVFLTNIFFQPTVVIGGQKAVKDFVSETELKSKVINSALPDTFKELHTKWGTLNLDANDVVFKQARDLFSDVFGRDALVSYTPIINEALDRYIETLRVRAVDSPEEEILLVPELKENCLQIFSTIFSGEGLSKEEVRMFNDYNAALLALPFEKQKIVKGKIALNTLTEVMLRRFKKFQTKKGNDAKYDSAATDASTNNYFFHQVSNREGFEDDRVASVIVLFVWGAYIECASLMVNSLTAINKYNAEYTNIIFQEVKEAQEKRQKNVSPTSEFKFWSCLDETLGVLRESERLIPPGGGTPRYSEEDFEFRGYRIPAGTAVMMDPRVGNTDPDLFIEPEEFHPSRWVPTSENSATSSSEKCPFQGTALKLGFGSWFPGGFGAHQCPGIPLAELTCKMFLAKTVTTFEKWAFGSGTKRNGEVKFLEVPIKLPVDNLGVRFSIRQG